MVVFIAVIAAFVASLVIPATAFAFKPAAHQTLLESVVASLPAGDPFHEVDDLDD